MIRPPLSKIAIFVARRCINKPSSNNCITQSVGLSQSTVPQMEPAYIDELKPKVGHYPLLNVNIKGHDYVILEKYQSYIHKMMLKLNFEIVKTWSVPQRDLEFESLAHQSTATESSVRLSIHQRNLQVKDALVTKLPILIDAMHMTLPPGVSFSINHHIPSDEDILYYRDSRLESAKEELQELKDTPLIGV